jgi:hypothetical protein
MLQTHCFFGREGKSSSQRCTDVYRIKLVKDKNQLILADAAAPIVADGLDG